MSHEDIVFNGNSFVDNLKLILRKEVKGITQSDLASRNLLDTSSHDANFVFSRFSTSTNPFVDWGSLRKIIADGDGALTEAQVEAAFLTDFKEMIGYVDGNGSSSDWHILSESVHGTGNDAEGFPKSVNDDLILEYFQRSMSHFLGAYPYVDPSDETQPAPAGSNGVVGSSSTAGDNFFTAWTQFMARTSEFDDSTTTTGVPDMAAYEQIYSAFYPPEAGETAAEVEARYAARLRQFWKSQAIDNGAQSVQNAWFIPSQSFDEWFEQLREEFIKGESVSSVVLSTVSGPVLHDGKTSAQRVLVIDRVLRLLIAMIDILQRISASQAQRLTFLTTWQQAYTDLITQVPQFAQGDGSPLGGSGTAAKTFRNKDVNPHMQSVLEKVRARRSAVQDEAKQTQTTINQSQDASNQQTQMATSLIQQLSTILSQIFR